MRAIAFLFFFILCSPCDAQLQSHISLTKLNNRLGGRIIDWTHNHGEDNRIWSPILDMYRDLYVYLPPGYSGEQSVPLVLWFHGGFGDEHAFLDTAQLEYLDALIRCGHCPPIIVACPDGIGSGRNLLCASHSFYVNGDLGRFEDHIVCEVVPLLERTFSISPHRRHRAIVGVSGGGLGALAIGMKHREDFGSVATLAGVVNLRYSTIADDYSEDFHPATYRWQSRYRPHRVIGKLGCLFCFRAKTFVKPVFGSGPHVLARIQAVNPADLLFSQNLEPGELNLFVGFGQKDEFNMDAQGSSFVHFAAQRGIATTVYCDPNGNHSLQFFRDGQQAVYRWLAVQFQTPPGGEVPLQAPSGVEVPSPESVSVSPAK